MLDLDPHFSQMQVSMYSASADATARLSLEGMFALDANKSTRVLFLEALVRGDDEDAAYEMESGRKVVQYVVRRGFGVRIIMQVEGWSSGQSLSISAVAAKSQVEGQSVQYYVETLGLPDSLEKDTLSAVGVTGPLNENSFVKLQTLVTKTLPEYLRKTPSSAPDATKGERAPLELAEYRVPVDADAEGIDVARSVHMAMTHLARGDSLARAKQALAQATSLSAAIGVDIIEQTYQRCAGISPAHADVTPPADAVTVARKWLQFQA
jgi:hypothetical protein